MRSSRAVMRATPTVSNQAIRESGTPWSVPKARKQGRFHGRATVIPAAGWSTVRPVSQDGEEPLPMNKTELAQQVASQGVDSGAAREAVDAVFETIANELSNGGEVSISGFGKFSVSDRAARQGVNPATGEKIQIAASKAAKFSAASGLKNKLNP